MLADTHVEQSRWYRLRILWLVLLAAALMAVPACRTEQPLAPLVDPKLLMLSDELRMLRQERAAVPLDERIAMIEADMERTLVEIGEGALVPRYIRHDGRKGSLYLEHNTAVLSALAAKYAVTGDEQAKTLGERIIKGIMEMDAASGQLDGFVHLELDARTFQPTERTTHSNAYTQLLFAYVFANEYFGPSEDIKRHVSLIYQRFAAHGFAMPHVDGSHVAKADLSSPLLFFNGRRTLDRRLLDHAAMHLGDERARELARHERWAGGLLVPLHVRLLNLEFPTPSSSWLNLQAMTALKMMGQPHTRRAVALVRRYEREDNPFFRVLAVINGGDEDPDAIRARLAEYPYPATSSGIINSHRDDVRIGPRRFVKWHGPPEAREPMPLYELRSQMYLWKNRMRVVDSMPEAHPRQLLGHDLYQAYWFLRLVEQD
jgi:hypothetical protein